MCHTWGKAPAGPIVWKLSKSGLVSGCLGGCFLPASPHHGVCWKCPWEIEPQDNHSFHTETNTGDCAAKTDGRAASGPDSQFCLKFEANPAQELLFSDSSFDRKGLIFFASPAVGFQLSLTEHLRLAHKFFVRFSMRAVKKLIFFYPKVSGGTRRFFPC